MTDLLTAEQMRAAEQAAMDSGEVTGLDLMERAGRGVVEAIFEEWPELAKTSHRALVLCGPGNNGGDGFVVARLLKEWGWEVEVFLYGNPDKLPPDARVNFERWGGSLHARKWDDTEIEDRLDKDEHDLVVDALFGIGLSRAMPDDTERAWHGFMSFAFSDQQSRRQKFVAVDIASGLCSDSGRNFEGAFPADLSVSFHRAKLGHYLCPKGPPEGGALWTGKIVIKDIGLSQNVHKDLASVRPRPAPNLGPRHLVQLVGAPKAGLGKDGAHKFSHGHALILSGGAGTTGAARLAARGALRIGAGLVTLGVPPAAQLEAASQLTAVMLARVADAAALQNRLSDERISALCLGPAMGLSDREAELISAALAVIRPTVLDADALTLIARDHDLFAALHDKCVLTPHAGEFARLFPDIAGKLEDTPTRGPAYSKVDATRDAAARAGCTILFKGPDTVIADPDGRCSINASVYERSAPWLATAGSGDVLAGFITGLLARGFSPYTAASTGAWLHTECALSFGPGLIAEDLPEELPKVLHNLGV